MLFAALPGQTFDGHDYIQQARSAVQLPHWLVATSRQTCRYCRCGCTDSAGYPGRTLAHKCPAKVIGITGSNGKTTVKEMVASILRQDGEVLATQGNFNNELGLPLTVFQLNKSHDYAVLEMGASNPGDIAYLAGIAQPEVGVITNIGPAHLQGFINIEGVARPKASCLQHCQLMARRLSMRPSPGSIYGKTSTRPGRLSILTVMERTISRRVRRG